ncbi:Fasciclin domain-containing protein [Pricia antarctica]|uniref:Fasciclin domain-containing protein n=1 Tax=Pricia antarctica TaxID=641691 RepID=A0A1G7J2A4_9FLAO|nr:fasciclin domain-containing protein [Pricia antarctica]SDF19060.1 Fasciclin domain-containing protein [Pricia antarctica]
MKYTKKFISITKLSLVLILLTGCDLDLQKEYDFDEDARIYEPSPAFETTIWEFMNQQQSDFGLMVDAIQIAGLENLYTDGGDDKTILMLRNEAMQEFLDDQAAVSLEDIPIETLQKFLRYHIITERFTQNDLNSQEDVQLQTLIEGNNGRINVWKWRRYMELQINRAGSPDLPSSAKGASVYLHNYEFTNGVGHQMQKFVRWSPF